MIRHRFEPARLFLGLLLVGTAVTYAMDAVGAWRVPLGALLLLVPASLTSAVCVAVMTYFVRRSLRRRRAARADQGTDAPGKSADVERNEQNTGPVSGS